MKNRDLIEDVERKGKGFECFIEEEKKVSNMVGSAFMGFIRCSCDILMFVLKVENPLPTGSALRWKLGEITLPSSCCKINYNN